MSGMDMMLKAMGLDPKVIADSAEQFKTMVAGILDRLDKIEANQRHIMLHMGLIDHPAEPSPQLELLTGTDHG